jgi:hypothetical protein
LQEDLFSFTSGEDFWLKLSLMNEIETAFHRFLTAEVLCVRSPLLHCVLGGCAREEEKPAIMVDEINLSHERYMRLAIEQVFDMITCVDFSQGNYCIGKW